MNLRHHSLVLLLLLLIIHSAHAIIPKRSGWWKFDIPTNLTKAEEGYGNALLLSGSHSFASGPEEGNGAILIGAGSYYKMNHLIAADEGKKVNEYTLQYDFKIQQSGLWHCFFQTSINNANDGDFFINPSGNIGVADVGYSNYPIIPNEWYRLLISVKNGSQFTCYLDGQLILKGNSQPLDGRFSLDNQLLVFADENGEDAGIYCAELSIWDQALTGAEASELGGYHHETGAALMTRIPYLQCPGQNSMIICWHDTAQIGTKVNYGTDSLSLGEEQAGASEMISDPYRWHTVRLSGLQANTRYFYNVSSGNETSSTYSFKTLPDAAYRGKIRFLILSDTHATDTIMNGKLLRASKVKMMEKYGKNIENQMNVIFNTGDIVINGNSAEHYTNQYFQSLSTLSANIPTMVTAGNHEAESPLFYRYMKLDELSAFPTNTSLNEKLWQLRVGNSWFIGLNTNIINQYGAIEASWLDAKLHETEQDTSIDFVFLFFHHPPFSEIWNMVNTFDNGANYVRDKIIPVIKKYTKVQEVHYGHTHGFERGTIESTHPDGDFRIICGGGGGGPLDPWAVGANHDYNDIHISYSEYCFQILEIDIAHHSFQNSMYSMGSEKVPRNAEMMDTWQKNKNQKEPEAPRVDNVLIENGFIKVNASRFSGLDSLMSVHLQASDSPQYSSLSLDTLLHWKNIYGITQNDQPVDLNRGINLNQLTIQSSLLLASKASYFRVRYRDHNLKWSNWSDSYFHSPTGMQQDMNQANRNLYLQNYPNPFSSHTNITYTVPESSEITIRVYDLNGHMADEIAEGSKPAGTYSIDYKADHIKSGVYFYAITTKKLCITKKMIKLD